MELRQVDRTVAVAHQLLRRQILEREGFPKTGATIPEHPKTDTPDWYCSTLSRRAQRHTVRA